VRLVLRLGREDPVVARTWWALIAVIGVFSVIHAIRWRYYQHEGLLESYLFDMSADWSLAEMANYLQTALLVALLVQLGRSARQPIYFGWTALYVLVLADDSLQLHERGGRLLVAWLHLPSVVGLRPQDLGEIMTWAVLGVPASAAVALGWWRTSGRHRLIGMLFAMPFAALLFFGMGVDALHELVKGLGIIEDGGEMVSIAAAVALALVLSRHLRSFERAAGDEPDPPLLII
jgi:hypothetical protein